MRMGPVVHCRMCLWPVEKVFELAPTPIANNFTAHPEPYAMRFPLYLTQCKRCEHVQQGYAIPGETLFSAYRYQTPQAERSRLAALAADLAKRYPFALRKSMQPLPTVLEIGCSNGIYVEELNKAGFHACGIDPSPHAPQSGLPKWFTTKTARQMESSFGKMKMIVSNNVFAHVDDLRNVLLGVKYLLDTDGVLVFEVQYLHKMIEGGMFDMIYHEHKDYHQIKTWPYLLNKFGMGIREVEYLPTHGGSVRFHVGFGENKVEVKEPKIDWDAFKTRIERERTRIKSELGDEKVAAFGATAKACTLIHHFGIAENIEFCIDETPSKQGMHLPGTNIPIVGMDALGKQSVLLTAWNYYDILKTRFNGNRLIVPFRE